MRWTLVLAVALVSLPPVLTIAQDDPNDTPLGDVARTMRRKSASSQDVIDNDNLSQVMDQAASRHAESSTLRFLMAGGAKGFQVSAPDVTCSLAFNANAKSLLSSQYAQMELPPNEVLKLEGPATIEGDALTISVFNGTDWHVSEVAVALTIVRKTGSRDESLSGGMTFNGTTSSDTARVGFGGAGNPPQESEVRPERKPDVTVIYRMRAAAAPFATTVFSAPLNLDLTPEQEWHWAIVQAKGYPPQTYPGPAPQTAAQTRDPELIEHNLPPALATPQDMPTAAASRIPR
jgi:hypothetical protein